MKFSDYISKFDWIKVALDDFNLLVPLANLYSEKFIKPKINYKIYNYNKVLPKSKLEFYFLSLVSMTKIKLTISIKNSYIQTIYYKTQGNDDSSQFKMGVLSNFHASSRINKKYKSF